jgi:hypothetical protein
MQEKFKGPTLKFYNGNEIPIMGYGTFELGGEDC